MKLEWQAKHSPIYCSDSIASKFKIYYPKFSLSSKHSLEANEGRLEETEMGVEGDRYEVVYKIVNFLWVAWRTVVEVEDGPEGEAV